MKDIITFDQNLSLTELAKYQLTMLNKQLLYAVAHSRFYRKHLSKTVFPLTSYDCLQDLPFTTVKDIISKGTDMVCLPGSAIRRIVTLQTSGTSGVSKKLYFSSADIERTIEFFAVGMRYLCGPKDTVLICMPGTTTDSVGQLLSIGLERIGAKPYIYGPISNYEDAVAACRSIRPHTIVGIPTQIRRLALAAADIRPANVLLSADYIADSLRATIERLWDCTTFIHYGLTESGLGCAVECPYHLGQHIRHDELFLEIVDPQGKQNLPLGEWGEIVITTLRREAMPLIHYRTGDLGRLLPGRCACGSESPRLDKVRGRLSELTHPLNIYQLDELLLSNDAIEDYTAKINGHQLKLKLKAKTQNTQNIYDKATDILTSTFPDITIVIEPGNGFVTSGTVKRSLI